LRGKVKRMAHDGLPHGTEGINRELGEGSRARLRNEWRIVTGVEVGFS
jgi:hypothetical protein